SLIRNGQSQRNSLTGGQRRFKSFFFSSRRRHTRCLSDWSSDVCSSDLTFATGSTVYVRAAGDLTPVFDVLRKEVREVDTGVPMRSEERRVGKECRSRWSPCR